MCTRNIWAAAEPCLGCKHPDSEICTTCGSHLLCSTQQTGLGYHPAKLLPSAHQLWLELLLGETLSLAWNPRVWSQWCQKEQSLLSLVSQLTLLFPPRQRTNSWLFFICICPHGDSKVHSVQHQDAVSPTVKDKKYKNCICSIDLLSWSSTSHRRSGLL